MKYSIIINPINKKSLASKHAIEFIRAILKEKCNTVTVFFYGYAVKNAFFNDDGWNNIINKNISLLACSTIAESFLSDKNDVLPAFKLVGLGQWLESAIDSDKRVEFV